jgi:hypothetical protein
MCYSSHKDFGRSTRKDAAREPEGRRETIPEEPQVKAEGSRLWAFLDRRREHKVEESIFDLTREKV